MRSIVFLAIFAILAPLTASQTQTKTCGDWTALQPVMVGAGETKCYTTTKETKRCIMRYKTGAGCKEMKLTCSRLYIDNSDYPPLCKDGDIFTTKQMGGSRGSVGSRRTS